jgi:hypothetical protein
MFAMKHITPHAQAKRVLEYSLKSTGK